MLRIGEYRSRADRLADHLPWAALVAPGIVLNKDGSFQRTFRFRGPDLESATEAELIAVSAQANNVFRRFGSGGGASGQGWTTGSSSAMADGLPAPSLTEAVAVSAQMPKLSARR